MAVASRKIRGLKDIRTNVDRCDQFVEPYKGYLRLGSLEMERARKLVERDNLIERLRVIEERCRQLDAEKEAILTIIHRTAASKGYTQQIVTHAEEVTAEDYSGKLPDKYKRSEKVKEEEKLRTAAASEREGSSQKAATTVSSTTEAAPRAPSGKTATSGFRIRY